MRKGMAKGTGKGYKNIMCTDKRVHSMSAKGIKQPQKINPIYKITPRGVGVKGYLISNEDTLEIISKHNSLSTAEKKLDILEGKKYKKGWSMKSDVPIVDFPESFGYKAELVWMSPQEFLKKAQSGYINKQKYLNEAEHREAIAYEPSIKKIKKGLKSEQGKVPIGYLEVDRDGNIDHEGRHRAWASVDLGIKKIPIKVVWNPKTHSKPDWI